MPRQMKITVFILIIAALFFSGIAAGNFLGRTSLNKVAAGEITAALVLFNPSSVYIDTVKLLNSRDPFKRLSGYYAYSDTRLIDLDYLYKRFTEEESPVIKNAIIWTASRSGKTDDVIYFFKKVYKLGSKRNQEFILNYIETKDVKLYNDFIETVK
jgi:hypothetical protein